MESDKYDVLEKIGHGSFGIIRKVRRKVDGLILCRKEISYNRMSVKEREQLQAELNILRGLRHPNIVLYLEKVHIKPSSELHIYMEYCEQGDLGKKIQELKTTNQLAPEDFVWSVFTQIVCGLYRCHYGEDAPPVASHVVGLSNDAKPLRSKVSHNMILHRDLKPENIFLGTDHSVKLGDFGLSKLISSHDFASTYVGTPYYMSPELCMSEPYNQHSDIWAFGCIMYELCVKSPPFNARTHVDLVQKIRAGRVEVPISNIYSSELREAISKCLRQNPLTRPDAAQLLNLSAVKLKRKELDVYASGRELRLSQERVERKSEELAKQLAKLEAREHSFKTDIENVVRREWEVKARLEIDRQLQMGMEQVWKNYEAQVAAGVAERLAQQQQSMHRNAVRSSTPEPKNNDMPLDVLFDDQHQSQSTIGGSEDLPSSTDISDLSIESPTFERGAKRTLKKPARTPFGRAQTMFHGSPMDVQMADPSPAPIASLGLSPRRTGKQKPSTLRCNIFDADLSRGDSADDEQAMSPNVDDSDDDDDGMVLLPSPSRPKTEVNGDPFKTRPSRRPSMPRQQTIATVQPSLQPAPALFNTNHSNNSSSGSSKEGNGAAEPASQPPVFQRAANSGKTQLSPNRRQSKLPSATSLVTQGESTSPTRKPNSPNKQTASQPNLMSYGHRLSSKKQESDIRQAAMANNHASNTAIQGRTLVEINNARANIASAPPEFPPGRVVCRERGGKHSCPKCEIVTWDPDREEMPSPFLARTSKSLKNVLPGAIGGPGLRHLR